MAVVKILPLTDHLPAYTKRFLIALYGTLMAVHYTRSNFVKLLFLIVSKGMLVQITICLGN